MALPDPIPVRFDPDFLAQLDTFADLSKWPKSEIIRRSAASGLPRIIRQFVRRFNGAAIPLTSKPPKRRT